ncbi:MAG TPA: UDP-N-acetylglucosamine--N-acetylmuramyl-(pentapeptide) pyrophosphoryl-undecaprenol N-acetylglucosamine transferase [Candidatus Paceibacterota bacterium]|jgi:UDP-N-acetylglucosamine--N-acetylmuramyl-(pentapeptide) pyrophosphoryl-undecaprenol N-acetylglucosamine transferase|nr:UDP-N-acetylglucosamine--N-acetylmuramyl-(pentapeptide) pyrophosphoryl-undecaprenol N-acetylglucosamine transferase [Candidatus Paceibacterota bacterium]
MKILLIGGGTGGHVYPLIAIAEELNRIADEEKIANFHLYYMSNVPYDQKALDEQFITFIPITAGKLRVYFSLQNFVDMGKTFVGTISAIFKLFSLYPDVIISKGGYAAFPTLVAARILRIPLIVHESDTVPGRVNKWSGKFARRVALSYPEAAQFFDAKKVSVTGQPVRKSIAHPATEGAKEFFELDPAIPVIGVIGGSLGAKIINDTITSLIPELVKSYQVIHQSGQKTYEETKTDAAVLLGDDVKRTRYKLFPFLSDLQTKMFGGAVDIVISRAGSMIYEIAAWGKPSIIIPGGPEVFHGDHQRKNAYHYARSGACAVIEETNLTPSVLMNEIEMILNSKERYEAMSKRAKEFYKPDAARMIAAEAVTIALEHEE